MTDNYENIEAETNVAEGNLPVPAHTAAALEEEVIRLREEVDELEAAFDLQWDASIRAIRMWQEKTGKTLVWPDRSDLIVWLLEQLEKCGGIPQQHREIAA